MGNPSGSVDAVPFEKGLKGNVIATVGHVLMAPMLVDASGRARPPGAPLAERLPLSPFCCHWIFLIFLHFEWRRLGMCATTPPAASMAATRAQ